MKARSARLMSYGTLLIALCVLLPGVAFGAEESKWGVLLPIGRLFNLALVVAVLVWAAREPLKSFFSLRSQSIRERLAEAERARVEAETKLAEIEMRMSRLDDELRAIKTAAEEEAHQEFHRLMSASQTEAAKIVDRAEQEIRGLTRAAQIELKAHVAELSVQLAEDRIRSEITDDDSNRLFARFVTGLGGQK